MNWTGNWMRVGLSVALAGCLVGPVRAQSVALTFDDLPETGDTPKHLSRKQIGAKIVAALTAAKAPEVYGFVNAGTLDDPAVKHLLERWRAAGFLLANHTYTHYSLDEHTIAEYEKDIEDNEPILRKLMGERDWHYFRYPYLAEGATLEKREAIRAYLKAHGYRIAEVTIDFQDSEWNDPYARCVAKKDEATIEQMKTMYVTSANEAIRFAQERAHLLVGRDIKHVMLLHYGAFEAVMLPTLLEILKERGFKLIPLPEALSDPIYAKDPKTVNDGGTFLDDLMEASDLEDRPTTPPQVEVLEGLCR